MILYVLAKINVLIGVRIQIQNEGLDNTRLTAFIVIFIILIVARILLEIIYKTSATKCINQKPAQITRALKPEEATLLKMLNEGADRS
jgi:hypothetical protein